jgi:hypothetical protein
MNNTKRVKDYIEPNEDNKRFICQLIFQFLAQDPSATKDFIEAVTLGIQQYASNQREESSKLHNYLIDILDKNHKTLKDGKFYPIGRIVNNVLPSWEGAGIHKIIEEKYKDKLKVERELVKKEMEEEAKKKKNHLEKDSNYGVKETEFPAPRAEEKS